MWNMHIVDRLYDAFVALGSLFMVVMVAIASVMVA